MQIIRSKVDRNIRNANFEECLFLISRIINEFGNSNLPVLEIHDFLTQAQNFQKVIFSRNGIRESILLIQKLLNAPKYAESSYEILSPTTPTPTNQDYRKLRGWAKAQYPEPESVQLSELNVEMKSESQGDDSKGQVLDGQISSASNIVVQKPDKRIIRAWVPDT